MGCGPSKPKVQEPAKKGEPAQTAPPAVVEKKEIGQVELYGVYPSMNVMGAAMLCAEEKCGKLVPTSPADGGTTTEAFLKINPFHGVPAIKDGNVCLAESNSIMRYFGGKYVPALYLNLETQRRSYVDWAMDRFASALYPDVAKTIYVVMGFAGAPADKKAVATKTMDNLNKFAEVFLKEKFIGGRVLSIADYKVAPFFFAYAHPKVKELCGVELCERLLQFNLDFKEACKTGAALLESAEGMSIKEILDAKSGHKGPMLVAKEGFKEATAVEKVETAITDFFSSFTLGGKTDVKIYGVAVSMNCVGPILFGRHCQIGDMEYCMPGEQSQTEEYKKMVPFGGVPGMKDGKWTMGESSAILRHMARTYAEEYYPKDPAKRAQIDWALDRWSFSMYNDCVATIYVAMGFTEAPKDIEALKDAGKAASAGLKEFADFFLKEKFVGGNQLSIADFKIAPFFAAYAHQRVKDKTFVEVPERIVKFNADFAEACPAAELFKNAEGFSIVEHLDSKTAQEQGATETDAQKEMDEAMAQHAKKNTVVTPEELGPNIESTSAPMCGCLGA